MKFKIIYFFVFFNLCFGKFYSQNINYSLLNSTSGNLKNFLLNNNDYFSGGNTDVPYFQGKHNNSYIKFYNSTGVIVVIDLKSKTDFFSLIRTVQNNAILKFKYCTDYDEPIVYNYETTNGNKIRFSYDKMRVSISYPSEINDFLNNNSGLSRVFVCTSQDAYAYHTNLRCKGLANCDSQIAKSNIQEAKSYNYQICEICTTDYSKESSSKNYSNVKNKNSVNTSKNNYYKNYSQAKKVSNQEIKKAELMFENYLPKLLKSKGENASIYNQKTYSGDFTGDGYDDIIIWFVYGYGGTAIGGIEAAFYKVSEHNKVEVVAGFAPNYRFSIDNIEKGIVYATKILYDKDDSQCCPSIKIPIKLLYSDNEIKVN